MEDIKRVKSIRKEMNYKGICFKITQLKNGNCQGLAGGFFVIAQTKQDAIYYIK